MELTEYMVKRIKEMSDKFYLILEPELVNVCFWYLPTRVRNMPHSSQRESILGEVIIVLTSSSRMTTHQSKHIKNSFSSLLFYFNRYVQS